MSGDIDLSPIRAETLAVFCTNRGDYVLRDHVDAIHWAHRRPHVIVVVDDTRAQDAPVESGTSRHGDGTHHIIPSKVAKTTHLSGFKTYEGIRWAMDRGLKFVACLSVDDDAMPIGRGLDDWALPLMERTAIDLLGVEDRVSYQQNWRAICEALARWIPEARNPKWVDDLRPEGVFFAVNWMSYGLCQAMHERSLLVPAGCNNWRTWPDVYITYVAQLLGFYTVLHGHMDDPKPPLYANHRNHMRFAPDPRILRESFLIYHPIRFVAKHGEEELRRHYAALRGSPPG
jgi:hypothetical protein